MPHDRSNILELVLYRDRRLAGKGPANEAHADDPGAKPAGVLNSETRAIVSCLDYLYAETIKLDERMAAHLIGAAAESLRQRIDTDVPPTGSAS